MLYKIFHLPLHNKLKISTFQLLPWISILWVNNNNNNHLQWTFLNLKLILIKCQDYLVLIKNLTILTQKPLNNQVLQSLKINGAIISNWRKINIQKMDKFLKNMKNLNMNNKNTITIITIKIIKINTIKITKTKVKNNKLPLKRILKKKLKRKKLNPLNPLNPEFLKEN